MWCRGVFVGLLLRETFKLQTAYGERRVHLRKSGNECGSTGERFACAANARVDKNPLLQRKTRSICCIKLSSTLDNAFLLINIMKNKIFFPPARF
jgi:hypothetical protein